MTRYEMRLDVCASVVADGCVVEAEISIEMP
jgi:hypothetical protein